MTAFAMLIKPSSRLTFYLRIIAIYVTHLNWASDSVQ